MESGKVIIINTDLIASEALYISMVTISLMQLSVITLVEILVGVSTSGDFGTLVHGCNRSFHKGNSDQSLH